MATDTVSIGSLRWPVTISKRVQAISGTSSITETLSGSFMAMADIQPIGPMTYLASEQIDRPITHRITVRWLDWLDITYVITRQDVRPDGTTRTETYRLRRLMEIGGRKRFLRIEAELETRE